MRQICCYINTCEVVAHFRVEVPTLVACFSSLLTGQYLASCFLPHRRYDPPPLKPFQRMAPSIARSFSSFDDPNARL